MRKIDIRKMKMTKIRYILLIVLLINIGYGLLTPTYISIILLVISTIYAVTLVNVIYLVKNMIRAPKKDPQGLRKIKCKCILTLTLALNLLYSLLTPMEHLSIQLIFISLVVSVLLVNGIYLFLTIFLARA